MPSDERSKTFSNTFSVSSFKKITTKYDVSILSKFNKVLHAEYALKSQE